MVSRLQLFSLLDDQILSEDVDTLLLADIADLGALLVDRKAGISI